MSQGQHQENSGFLRSEGTVEYDIFPKFLILDIGWRSRPGGEHDNDSVSDSRFQNAFPAAVYHNPLDAFLEPGENLLRRVVRIKISRPDPGEFTDGCQIEFCQSRMSSGRFMIILRLAVDDEAERTVFSATEDLRTAGRGSAASLAA